MARAATPIVARSPLEALCCKERDANAMRSGAHKMRSGRQKAVNMDVDLFCARRSPLRVDGRRPVLVQLPLTAVLTLTSAPASAGCAVPARCATESDEASKEPSSQAAVAGGTPRSISAGLSTSVRTGRRAPVNRLHAHKRP
eukprot:6468450-Prymnesium_polylepis.2